jgi:hypothetical protein
MLLSPTHTAYGAPPNGVTPEPLLSPQDDTQLGSYPTNHKQILTAEVLTP